MQDNDGRWHPWNQQALIDAMRELPGRTIAIKAREGEKTSEAKKVLLWLRKNRALNSVMTALPGYKTGVYDLPGGERVLVKRGPVKIEPVAGVPWPTIRKIIEGMLGKKEGSEEIDQTPWFWSLCKCWYRAFVTGSPDGWKQGHAVIFTGPAGCGKKVCIAKSREYASGMLHEKKIITGWPQDVMRHSYISYRIARGDGIGIVAEHAGNSERIIRRHYRRPLRKEDGEGWFEDRGLEL